MKVLKRYSNRRLYDADSSKTMTLEDVALLIKNGEEIKVIDNQTGEDLTARILGQTFLKVSMDQKNIEFSNFLMTALIREVTGNVSEFFARIVQSGIGAAALTAEKLQGIIQAMIEQGDLKLAEKDSYLDELLSQLSGKDLTEKAAAGRQVLRDLATDHRILELSDKLTDMARLVSELQQKEKSPRSG